MKYQIQRNIGIIADEEDFVFRFATDDEHGTVRFTSEGGITETIYIPKDCLPYVIDCLEEFL